MCINWFSCFHFLRDCGDEIDLTSVVPYSWRAIVDWSRLCLWTSIGRFRSMSILQSAFVNNRNRFASAIVAMDWRYLLCCAWTHYGFYGSIAISFSFWLQRVFFKVLFAMWFTRARFSWLKMRDVICRNSSSKSLVIWWFCFSKHAGNSVSWDEKSSDSVSASWDLYQCKVVFSRYFRAWPCQCSCKYLCKN